MRPCKGRAVATEPLPHIFKDNTMLLQTCSYSPCHNLYTVRRAELNRGNGKFCSRTCFALARSTSTKKSKPSNTTCAYCKIDFYRPPSKLSDSKSGLHFCSRAHKDIAQRIGGIKEIQPTHYGEVPTNYRTTAMRATKHLCAWCKYTRFQRYCRCII